MATTVVQVTLPLVVLASKGPAGVHVDISKAQYYSGGSPGGLWAW